MSKSSDSHTVQAVRETGMPNNSLSFRDTTEGAGKSIFSATSGTEVTETIATLQRMDQRWRESGVEPADVYETLLTVFLKPRDPDATFFPCDNLIAGDQTASRSIASLLAL